MGCIAYFIIIVTFFSVSEMYILLAVAERTSIGTTILLCILTGLVGGALIRREGLLTLSRAQKELGRGKMPADEIIGGILLIIMGVLLCVPGFITDTLGFLIIIPGIRFAVAGAIKDALKRRIADGSINVSGGFGSGRGGGGWFDVSSGEDGGSRERESGAGRGRPAADDRLRSSFEDGRHPGGSSEEDDPFSMDESDIIDVEEEE